ncbi:MAG: hypothetical protein R3F61_08430 [Myxococcota bacterium]
MSDGQDLVAWFHRMPVHLEYAPPHSATWESTTLATFGEKLMDHTDTLSWTLAGTQNDPSSRRETLASFVEQVNRLPSGVFTEPGSTVYAAREVKAGSDCKESCFQWEIYPVTYHRRPYVSPMDTPLSLVSGTVSWTDTLTAFRQDVGWMTYDGPPALRSVDFGPGEPVTLREFLNRSCDRKCVWTFRTGRVASADGAAHLIVRSWSGIDRHGATLAAESQARTGHTLVRPD